MKFRATDNTKTDTLIGWGLFPERFKVLTGISHLYNKHLKSYKLITNRCRDSRILPSCLLQDYERPCNAGVCFDSSLQYLCMYGVKTALAVLFPPLDRHHLRPKPNIQ